MHEVVVPAAGDTAGRRMFARSSGWSSHPTAGRSRSARWRFERSCASSSMRRRSWPTSCTRPSSTTRWASWSRATPTSAAPLILDRSCIRPVGFERDEALVESPPRSFPGYELLTEYFVFPQKFLFFDVDRLGSGGAASIRATTATIRIDICLDRSAGVVGAVCHGADVPAGVLPDHQPVPSARRVDAADAASDGVPRRS